MQRLAEAAEDADLYHEYNETLEVCDNMHKQSPAWYIKHWSPTHTFIQCIMVVKVSTSPIKARTVPNLIRWYARPLFIANMPK